MKFALWLSVLAMSAAFACATPTEYRDGPMVRRAPVRAVPGFTPPGTGLPEYMPQPESPAYPRSPHKRPLPPQRGPGIWAGDGHEPPGTNDPVPPVKILDVEIPLPPEVETRQDAWLAVQCAYIMDLGMRTNIGMQTEIMRRPKDIRCMAALAFYWCTTQLGQRARDELDTWERDGTLSDSGRRSREKLGPVEAAGRDAALRECGFPAPAWTRSLYPLFDQMQHGRVPMVTQ